MPKASAGGSGKPRGGGGRKAAAPDSLATAPSASAAPSAAAAPFRSPVGCTAPGPGEPEFLAWCATERVRFPSSRLAVLPGTGRSLVASRGVRMGEVVVELPDDAVLMAENCSIAEAMVPVWDLLNHITGEVNVRLHHCPKRHVLQMIATRDIAAGAELVNNYGQLSNSELLRGYGFVEQRNANNHAQVPLSFVLTATRQVAEQQGAASAQGAGASKAAGRAGSGSAAGPGPGSSGDAAGGPEEPFRRAQAARLRLGVRLGLLPQHNVFKVFAGRPPSAHMTLLILLLTADDAEFGALRRAADTAARGALGKGGGGGGGEGKRGRGGGDAEDGGGEVGAEAAQAAAAAAVLAAAVAAVDPKGPGGRRTAEARVVRVYEQLVERMLGRYTCSLEEDQRLVAAAVEYDRLSVRQRAAVMARKPEKEALVALGEQVRREGCLLGSLRAAPPAAATAAAVAGAAGSGKSSRGGEGKAGAAGSAPRKAANGGAGAAVAAQAGGASFSFGFTL
ncbi:N-lysine methyltransferase setd6 [Tetrabaena socialis]|uniref:N-lysine methyltransferase setd6 n=1 Tax=Tetrabaena socialis TaxID=47790 RepID=A0A2J8A8X1_9CHLO|nr:N-lysine methyltransferase setd6 [Tetrabaena socialis]|eukprot:PNH08982.1 N-lysine methyltransferase setd6 [Tetrabaena socialis]